MINELKDFSACKSEYSIKIIKEITRLINYLQFEGIFELTHSTNQELLIKSLKVNNLCFIFHQTQPFEIFYFRGVFAIYSRQKSCLKA